MAAFFKFNQFVEDLCKGVHQLHAAGHQLEIYLSNAAPSASLDLVKTDLAEITNQNGYTAPVDVQNDLTETAGTATLTGVSFTITASGGVVGPFQHVVLMNTTPTSPADPLIGSWDYGGAITLQTGESLDVKFNGSAIGVAGTIFTFV